VARHYSERGLLGGWVIDEVDRAERGAVEALGIRVSVVDSIMVDDEASERLVRAALEVAMSGAAG
jgi:LPPG:FO 2-phospho-L-lactate transferase